MWHKCVFVEIWINWVWSCLSPIYNALFTQCINKIAKAIKSLIDWKHALNWFLVSGIIDEMSRFRQCKKEKLNEKFSVTLAKANSRSFCLLPLPENDLKERFLRPVVLLCGWILRESSTHSPHNEMVSS